MAKHIMNDSRQLVNDSLQGLARLNPYIRVDEANRVTYLANVPNNRVALISGGGSGHEPAHAGFVGNGLLTAAISGNIFASPNVGQIRRAIDLVNNYKGIVAIIMRYTGDVLQFGLAKEQHAVTNPNSPFYLTIVGDDCAVGRRQGGMVGRRGLAGTILTYKIASALADEGADVEAVHDIAEYVATRLGSIGAGLEHCHVPGTAKGEAHLGDQEIEIGMGIHNEIGILKWQLPTSEELIRKMLNFVIDINDLDRGYVPFKHDGEDEVVLLVNNLGGMSELELSSIANDTIRILRDLPKTITVKRLFVGSFMTSLNLPGFSLSILLLPRDDAPYSSTDLLHLLDSYASSPGWRFHPSAEPSPPEPEPSKPIPTAPVKSGVAPVHVDYTLLEKAVISACESIIAAESEITRYDTIAGDGDCGLTLKSGATGIINAFKSGKIDKSDLVMAILNIATFIENDMDGTSGALYSIWFNALASGISKAGQSSATPAVWAVGLSHALRVLCTYTAARRPSRTLIDPLSAFTDSFASSGGADLQGAVSAATRATEETKYMQAKAGRAAYVDQNALEKAQVPDPGACGVLKILEGLVLAL